MNSISAIDSSDCILGNRVVVVVVVVMIVVVIMMVVVLVELLS